MADFHVFDSLSLYHSLESAQPGDNIWQHQGVYIGLDSYNIPIRGGTSRAKTLKIRPWRKEKVTWTASGLDFVIHLAHGINSFVEFGSNLIDTHVDASNLSNLGPATGIKVTTSTGGGGANHVRFYRYKIHGAFRQGILLTGVVDTQFIGGASYDNGWDTTPDELNKNHGLYVGKGCWDTKTFDFHTYRNAAYGISEYGGGIAGAQGRNQFLGGYHFQNARLSKNSAGILLSGDKSWAREFVSTMNPYGVNIYRTARGCDFDGDMEGNIIAPYNISPEALDIGEPT